MTAHPIRPTSADTIVLLHGLWMTPLSWGDWIRRYTGFGFLVLAPAWPGLEGEIEAIRRDPSPLEGLGVTEIVDHYKRIIRGMDRPQHRAADLDRSPRQLAGGGQAFEPARDVLAVEPVEADGAEARPRCAGSPTRTARVPSPSRPCGDAT